MHTSEIVEYIKFLESQREKAFRKAQQYKDSGGQIYWDLCGQASAFSTAQIKFESILKDSSTKPESETNQT